MNSILSAMALIAGFTAKVAAGSASFFGCHQIKEPSNISAVLKKNK